MTTTFDIFNNLTFRQQVEQRLSTHIQDLNYMFSANFPTLYKYRSISKYSVDDVVNGKFTATTIGNFNDVYDGAIHTYGSDDEISKTIEDKWNAFEKLRSAAHIPDELLSHESWANMWEPYFRSKSKQDFRLVDYLGMFVVCLSETNNSILMWSHYAEDNTGICVAYNFNELPSNCQYRGCLFPVAYSTSTLDISDLIDKREAEHPLETAMLCASLNKSSVWAYEHEWRLLLPILIDGDSIQRIEVNSIIYPSAIFFGYHFLKPCFYYGNYNEEECNKKKQHLEEIHRLLDFVIEKNIPTFVMKPAIGRFELVPQQIESAELKSFIMQNFRENAPESVRYYNTILDRLVDWGKRKDRND